MGHLGKEQSNDRVSVLDRGSMYSMYKVIESPIFFWGGRVAESPGSCMAACLHTTVQNWRLVMHILHRENQQHLNPYFPVES